MKIYISGPISGDPDYKRKFAKVEKMLISEGHSVINPAKKNGGFTYKEYIDLGLFELMQCDAICMLPGYEDSKGAMLEKAYALTVGMKVYNLVGGMDGTNC